MNRTIYAFLTLVLSIFVLQISTAQCHIFEVSAVQSDCDGEFFSVTLDFEWEGVGNEGFSVFGNGVNYGNFEYADVPITIGPLEGNCVTDYEFVVKDNQFNDCQNWTAIGPVCCGVGDCAVYDLVFDVEDCNPNGTYDFWLNFQYQDPGNDFFDVIYNGQNIGYYSLADLPVKIENFEDNGEDHPVIAVCINDMPDCCVENEFEAPNCTGSGDCEIWDVTAVVSDCENGHFYVTLDFNYQNVGNAGFDVFGNGMNHGHFSYDDLPVTIGPLPGNGTTNYEFLVKDTQHPSCNNFTGIGTVDCGGGGDCNIYDLTVEVGDCNPDGTYHLWINFEVENPGNDFFKVLYNGASLGTFPLSELPLHLPHFEDNGEPNQAILVCIIDNPNCCEDVGFESPNCSGDDCHIYDLFAEAHDCDANGQFMVDIEFESQNTGDIGFTIQANGQEFGPFEYGEPYYTFGPLEDGTVYEIVISDNANPNCHGFLLFGSVYCDDNCHIYDLHAEVTDCDDDGQFFVILDFEFSNTGNDGFKVVGNGNNYGFFDYADLPITLGPFQTPIGDLEFIARDVQHPDCHDFVEVEAPNCDGNEDCNIYDLVADLTPCFDDGTFYVVLDFQFENTSDIGFKVQGNGINYGLFSYDDVPISIGPLVGNGSTPYEFVVRDLLFHDCFEAVEVGPVDCEPAGDCEITNLFADAGSCHDDGTYNLWLNFSYSNATSPYFGVYYQGVLVDVYPLANLPIVIPHFQDNGNPEQEITVCINDNPNCCATTEYEAPDCNGPNLVWPGDGNANNITDHFDLLNIGIAFGAEGQARSNQGFEWAGQEAEQWPLQFSTGLNYNHADCNGDGVVNAADMQAIELNFGKTHGDFPAPILIGGSPNDPLFFADFPDAMTDGQQFTVPLILGTEGNPVEDLYGVAFTLNYDPEMIDPSSIQLQYNPSWLGVANVNLLTFDRASDVTGEIKVALVRSDQNDVSGHGQIAAFIGIIDNIAGKETMRVEITDVKAIQENEVLIPLYRPGTTVQLTTGATELVQGAFRVFPNPASSEVYLQHPDNLSVLSVEVKNMNGMTQQVEVSQNNSLKINDLAPGVYFLKIETEKGFFLEKLVKMN